MEADEINILIITVTIILLVLGFFILVLFILYRNKQIANKKKIDLLNGEILKTQLEIQEQTLKTISQEIHDNIGQVLSLAKLNLNTMEIERTEELKEKILDSKKLVSKAIQDLRDLSKSMNTDNIEAIGLIRALEIEFEMIRKTGFKMELDVEGSIIRLEPQKELILFRIIQEVLNNIIKHAEATLINTKIVYAPNEIRITVIDNGKGFDLTPLSEGANVSFGLGIRNMHNRAKLIGAAFNMSSTIGEGTEVTLIVPLNNHNL